MPDPKPGEVRVLVGNPMQLEGWTPDGLWRCIGDLIKTDQGRLVVSRLVIEPWRFGDQIGVSTDVLRKLPLGRWLASAHATMSDSEQWLATGELSKTDEGRKWARRAAEQARSMKLERGPKGYPPDHYRRIAIEYLDLQAQGVGRGIQKRLAEIEHVNWQTIRDWLNRAKELEFLSAGTPGRAGRSAGPNLYKEA
jgi:hypothetical protein